MIHIITSDQAAQLVGIKVCVHSRAGFGKTTLCATAPSPLIISAESGMLALSHLRIPTVVITKLAEMYDVYRFLTQSADARYFATVCLDSISELAEVVLGVEKGANKDPRKAYGNMQDDMTGLIRAFRDLPGKNVYFSAKQRAIKDDVTGVTLYGPSMPGQQLAPNLPYFFDEVFALDVAPGQDGRPIRYLRTQPDIRFDCKDRSGTLDPYERPDLTHIFTKIRAGRKAA